jgi:hypothetical protein
MSFLFKKRYPLYFMLVTIKITPFDAICNVIAFFELRDQ